MDPVERQVTELQWVARAVTNRVCYDPAEWDDIYQDAMMGVLDAVRRYDPKHGKKLAHWVYMRARYEALAGLAQRRHLRWSVIEPPTLDLAAAERLASHESEDDWCERIDRVDRFRTALAGLPAKQRDIVADRLTTGDPMHTVGERHGVTESRVSQIMTAAGLGSIIPRQREAS